MPDPLRPPAPGFTLIEFAIVLAIVAILLRVAAPGMGRGVAARALAAQAAEFMSALRFARSEALKRGAVVTLCATDVSAATSQCRPARAADWGDGWLVFVDAGSRGHVDAGDQLLRVQQPLLRTGGVAGTRASISFTAAGFSADASSHYLFDPPPAAANDTPASIMVCVSKQGRPRLAGTETCD
jgi:type IV fimbrial biogenesis protein FimT